MIEQMWRVWCSQHPEQSGRLDRAFRAWCCQVIDKTALGKVARSVKLYRPFLDFRQTIDGLDYLQSWLWRACWEARRIGRIDRAAARYRVDARDVRWALNGLTAPQTRQLDARVMTPWVRQPDQAVLHDVVESMRQYAERHVEHKLAVVWRYDPGYPRDGLVDTMLLEARARVGRYTARIVDVLHLRGLAWRAALNWSRSFIKQYARTGQVRVMKVGTDEVAVKTAVWSGGTGQTVTQFKTTAQKARDEVKVLPVNRFLPSIRVASELSHEDRSGNVQQYDVPVDAMDPSWLDSRDFMDQLAGQPAPVRQVCAIVLGHPVPAFDGWLSTELAGRETKLNDRQLVREACRFVGVPLKTVQHALAPVLGVAHAA